MCKSHVIGSLIPPKYYITFPTFRCFRWLHPHTVDVDFYWGLFGIINSCLILESLNVLFAVNKSTLNEWLAMAFSNAMHGIILVENIKRMINSFMIYSTQIETCDYYINRSECRGKSKLMFIYGFEHISVWMHDLFGIFYVLIAQHTLSICLPKQIWAERRVCVQSEAAKLDFITQTGQRIMFISNENNEICINWKVFVHQCHHHQMSTF